MVPELRPRGIGEVLDAAVALYRARFGQLLRVTAYVVFPLQALASLIVLSAQPDKFNVSITGSATPSGDAGSAAAQAGATFTVLAIALVSTAFVVAVCTRIVADAYVDHPEKSAEAMRVAGRRLFAVIGVSVVVAIAEGLGFLACFVGVAIPLVLFAVAVPVLILEQTGVFASLGRSARLTKSRFFHVLGLIAAAQLLGYVVSFSLTGLVNYLLRDSGNTTLLVMLQGLAAAVSATVTRPFLATVTVALYFDLRVRVEGFDVQMLMQRVDARHAAAR